MPVRLILSLLLAAVAVAPVPGGSGPPSASGQSAEEAPAPRSGGGWLGVWISDAVDGGVEILALAGGGPAQRAGLVPGDILLEADGVPIADEESLGVVLDNGRTGQEVRFFVLRGGEPIHLPVILGKRRSAEPVARILRPAPARAPRVRDHGNLGLQVTLTTPALRVHFGAPDDVGVLVTRVEAGRPADVAGIRVGDLLVEVAGARIAGPPQLRKTLSRWDWSEPLQASLVRAGERYTVTLPVAESALLAPVPELAAAEDLVRRAERLREGREAARQAELERRRESGIEQLQRSIQLLERELARRRAELERLEKDD